MQHKKDRRDKCDLYELDYPKIRTALRKIYQRFGDIPRSHNEVGIARPVIGHLGEITPRQIAKTAD
jgi:hypothetical protein